MAGKAGGGAEHLAPVGKVAALHALLREGSEFFLRPNFHRPAGEDRAHVLDGGLLLGLLREQIGEGGFLAVGQRGHSIGADELNELLEAGAALVIGGL